MSDVWTVRLRNPDGVLVDEVVDWTELDARARFNAVGRWTLALPPTARAVADLTRPGWGVSIVSPTGATFLSGPMERFTRTRDGRVDRFVFIGSDDLVWLARRLAYPEPLTAAPPYATNAHDVRSGVASTVIRGYVDANVGPAALPARRVPGLTLAPDLGLGSTLTGRGRWQTVLDLVVELAAVDGLGVRVVDLDAAVYAPADRSADVRLGLDRANVDGFDYELAAPSSNYQIVGGGGELTARTIVEGQDPTSIAAGWGRIEAFRDRRDTTVVAELAATATAELATGAPATSVSVQASTVAPLVGEFTVGDRITVDLDDVEVVDTVREIVVKVDDDEVIVRPTVGSLEARDPASVALVRRLVSSHGRRLADLERR